jgi:hypothetical protein
MFFDALNLAVMAKFLRSKMPAMWDFQLSLLEGYTTRKFMEQKLGVLSMAWLVCLLF